MCRSGCREGNHSSWGECARAAHLNIGHVQAQEWRASDGEVDLYKQARRDGLVPEGIYKEDVERAYRKKETDDIVSAVIAEG